MRAHLDRTIAAAGLDPDAVVERPRRTTWRGKMRAMVSAMVAALRAQQGINVRLPSAHAAPFRAVAISYHQLAFVLPTPAPAGDRDVVYCPVNWTGPVAVSNASVQALLSVAAIPVAQPFPEAFIGHVTRIDVVGHMQGTLAGALAYANPLSDARWSVLLNEQTIAGGEDRIVSATAGDDVDIVLGAGRIHQFALGTVDHALRVPVHVAPGQRMHVRVEALPSANPNVVYAYNVCVEGWMYPARSADDSVRGTMAD